MLPWTKQYKILKYFYIYQNNRYSGRQISEYLNINHKTCLKILNEYADNGLLKREIIGNAHVFGIHICYYWKNILFDMFKKENLA